MMHPLILVAMGGAIGSMARYGLSALVIKQVNPTNFPWGTFSVNILGCMLAGVFLLAAESMQSMSQEARLFIVTGLLGGFTTFSAFGIETLALLRRGELLMAISYASLSIILGVLAMWLTYNVLKVMLT
ncbi:MAG: fluoride efflux transporter CrcB [Moraxellaceae bacterium]|jgi:CrcB protein|nr:MAG: fluoride efflux transporter CrcB [Moraxellaceae bacterium]